MTSRFYSRNLRATRVRQRLKKLFPSRFLGALLIVHVLLIAAMAVSPQLHELAHADAEHADHECAVTLFASGSCESAAPVVSIVAFFDLLVAFVSVAEDTTSFFLSCRIFERGPPALA